MDSAHRAVIQLVENLTDKRSSELDFDALRRLKQLCRASAETLISRVFDVWLERLNIQDARVNLALN